MRTRRICDNLSDPNFLNELFSGLEQRGRAGAELSDAASVLLGKTEDVILSSNKE
jgi:hypothetical protein